MSYLQRLTGRPLAAVAIIMLILGGSGPIAAGAGHFSLAFQRKLPAWENNAKQDGTRLDCQTTALGGRACRVWVWDENGDPVGGVDLYTTWGVLMGTTDDKGRCEISFNTGIGFDLVCIDGSDATSDVAREMTAELTPCYQRHSWEVGFLYKADVNDPGTFDTNLYGDWPAMGSFTVQVPYTKSLAFNGVDYTDYFSDDSYWSTSSPMPPWFGQTFVATGNRVVAARVQGTIGGLDLLDWKLQILDFPSLQPVGPVSQVPVEWPFGWEAYWGVNDNPVVPGHTYMLKIWRDGGMNIYHVTGDVYPGGMYYEGSRAMPQYDLNGHIVCMTYEQYGQEKGLAAYWKLDEQAGSTAVDSSGNGNDGTLMNGPRWVADGGRFGGCLQFDGDDDMIDVTDFLGIPWKQSRTVGVWVKTSAATEQQIMTWGTPGPGSDWVLYIEAATGAFGVSVGDGYIAGSRNVADDKWHHVAIVLDADSDPDISEAKLYVDGLLEANNAVVPHEIFTAQAEPVYISGTSARRFTGCLDDIVVFDKALSGEQVQRLFALGGESFLRPCGRVDVPDSAHLAGDINRDCIVNGIDFGMLCSMWLSSGTISMGDFNGDAAVDARDFDLMAADWVDRVDPGTYAHLVARYKLDESEGAVAGDSIAGNDGTCYGDPVWQRSGGRLKGALLLDGVDDYVATPVVLNPADGPFSAFAWVKGGAFGQTIICQGDGSGEGRVWLSSSAAEGKIATSLTDGTRWTKQLVGTAVVTDGQWHHVGVVWTGTHRLLYADGVQVAIDYQARSPLKSADGGLYLGADKSLTETLFWAGLLDDVRVYDIALSAEQVAELAQ